LHRAIDVRALLSIVATSLLVFAACERGDLGRGARTTLTSGETHPSPPPQSRTVDDSGFVDNAGRSSQEGGSRPTTSGVRAAETSADRPTGTNTGAPNGARTGSAGPPEGAETAQAPASGPRVTPLDRAPLAGWADVPARVGRALCDHASVCSRVGHGRTWPSDGACVSAMRARAATELEADACEIGVTPLASCLTAIRAAPCGEALDSLGALTECRDTALCAP
jgi:hypothetical protein